MDILLSRDGDITFDERGDIQLVDSVRQKIQIRLRWHLGEWRWMPDAGVDYYGKILVKNPYAAVIEREVRRALADIEEAEQLDVDASWDTRTRRGTIIVVAKTSMDTIREEVEIDGRLRNHR